MGAPQGEPWTPSPYNSIMVWEAVQKVPATVNFTAVVRSSPSCLHLPGLTYEDSLPGRKEPTLSTAHTRGPHPEAGLQAESSCFYTRACFIAPANPSVHDTMAECPSLCLKE